MPAPGGITVAKGVSVKNTRHVERFNSFDLGALREGLMQAELDPSEASGLLAAFLNGRGYGVDARLVQDAVLRMDDGQCEPERMQQELERVALVM